MLTCFYAAKGGSGTTVVSAALAVELAERRPHSPVTLVDLAGDLPGVLGVESGPGVSEWLEAGPDVPIAALARVSVAVSTSLELIRRGSGCIDGSADRRRVFVELLGERVGSGTVIVDCGVPATADSTEGPKPLVGELMARAADRLLVTRPCYLALSRAARSTITPTGVVLVDEPGRALRATDVENVIGSPVVARVQVDPLVARAVDCGLFARRAPRTIRRAVAPLAANATPRR